MSFIKSMVAKSKRPRPSKIINRARKAGLRDEWSENNWFTGLSREQAAEFIVKPEDIDCPRCGTRMGFMVADRIVPYNSLHASYCPIGNKLLQLRYNERKKAARSACREIRKGCI